MAPDDVELPEMTRVLRLITRLNIGGPAIQALMLTRDLADRFPTTLAAGREMYSEGEMTDDLVPIERVPFLREIDPIQDMRAFVRVRNLIDSVKPRIVHTHMAKAGAIGRLAAARSALDVRTVHTFHGHVLDGYFGKVKERAFISAERYLARRTDALIAVSPQVRDALLDLGIGRPEQWRVVPLGFDLEAFLGVTGRNGTLRQRIGIDASTPLIGTLGRLAPVKDHALLLEAVARIPDAHLAILGDGELRTSLEQQAMRSDLAGRVHFMGWERNVAGAIADMDVVATSSINEGTPVALIEALACARPVVSTSVGGVPFVVDDGETGLLLRDRSPATFAGLLTRLLQDEALRTRFGTEGRKRMSERFSKDRLIQNIARLYTELSS